MLQLLRKGGFVLLVFLGCFLENQALEPETVDIDLEPSKCIAYSFDVSKSVFNLTMDTSKFPKGCNPQVMLKTSWMQSADSCVAHKWRNLKCDVSIEKEEDICKEWALLGRMFQPTNATHSQYVAVEKGWECQKRNYFIGFMSSCGQQVTLSLKVQSTNLTGDENGFCMIFGQRGKIFFEKLTVEQLIGGLISAFVMFLILSIWICAQCPCCPFHRWIKSFSEDHEEEEERYSRSRSRRSRRFDPDSIEEALLEQEEEERRARQKRRNQPVKKDKRPQQPAIPE